MSTQISLDDEDIDAIKDILKKHKAHIIFCEEYTDNLAKGLMNNRIRYNEISIIIAEETEEKWYIQIN